MKYQAKWGKKGFLVSPTKIVPFTDFKTGKKLKSDSKNDTSGKNPTNTRGVEAQEMSFSVKYLAAAGVNPRAQYEEWCGELGKSYPLYIEGKRFGPEKMMLQSVDMGDTLFSPAGALVGAVLSISLIEDTTNKGTTAARKTTTKTTSTSTKAAQTYEKTVAAKKEAMNATASKEDKASKNPSGTVVKMASGAAKLIKGGGSR